MDFDQARTIQWIGADEGNRIMLDMKAALKEVAETAEMCGSDLSWDWVAKTAKAAIAKAEGRS